jgi:uncharacterized membrane protein
MAYQTKKSFIFSQVYSQVMIIALAVLNTFFPEYLSYTFFLFVAMSMVLSFFAVRSQLKGVGSEHKKEIQESKKLIEVNTAEISKLMRVDDGLNKELAPQAMSSLMSLGAMVFVIIWYYFFFPYVNVLTQGGQVTEILRFLAFLGGYEVPAVLMSLLAHKTREDAKKTVQILRSGYSIFEQGIVAPGVAIKFPTESYQMISEPKRNFVDLKKQDKESPQHLRFYNAKQSELLAAFKKHAFPAKSKGQK